MENNLFLPKTLKVGFDKRNDTYTGKLAYVTYIDEKGVLRKQKSWETWRDQKIDPLDLENVPTSGFVLNKKAGGYSTGWNHRQTYIRIYDPRGFEFEITVENLLYILENTNSIKGKGLEGEFVYGWSGKDLVLLPTSSPDYKEIQDFNNRVHQQVKPKAKDLIQGATYLTKQNEEVVYLGKFDCYTEFHSFSEGKKHFFRYCDEDGLFGDYLTLKSISQKILAVVDDQCIPQFADLMDELESCSIYSPFDTSKDEFEYYEWDDFIEARKHWDFSCFTNEVLHKKLSTSYQQISFYSYPGNRTKFSAKSGHYGSSLAEGTLEELFEKLKPMYLKRYLQNGKLHKTTKSVKYWY